MAARILSCLIALSFVLSSTGPLLAVQPAQPSVSPAAAVPTQAAVSQALRSSPVMFIENVGQFADGARFQVRGGVDTMWLAEDALWITTMARDEAARSSRAPRAGLSAVEPLAAPETPRAGANIRLSFPGANAHPRLEPFDRLDTVVSYFLGNDPDKWRPNVPVWGGVRYVDLYPDVDLELTSEDGQMVQRLTARPGANLSAVQLRVEGADAVAVDGDALRLSTAAGEATLPLLRADGSQVAGLKVQPRGTQAFDVAAPFAPTNYNPASRDASSRQSAIYNLQSFSDNPADLLYGTFLGGYQGDWAGGIVVDDTGCAYVTGLTWSGAFPVTPGAFATSYSGGADAFVVKLDAAGSGLVYATFLGGSNGMEQGAAIALDGIGRAYVTGYTYSGNFPTTPDAFDTSYNGGMDAFVVKLTASGSALVYATFLGGSGDDAGGTIAVDVAGGTYVAGGTGSSDFPTTLGAFDTSYNGNWDAFVVKLEPNGSGLDYATFLGGSNNEYSSGIAVNAAGSVFVAGQTASSDFPVTLDSFDRTYNDGGDAFVVKLNPPGSGLFYATFLGGSGSDEGRGIAVDRTGSVYVAGVTASSNFPTTPDAFDTSFNGGYYDTFVVKLDAAGSELAYSTFLGGTQDDYGNAIDVDGAGRAYVTGYTYSNDFPTTPGAFDTSYYWVDAFIAKLDAAGSGLAYATFLSGNAIDGGQAIAVDAAGRTYVTGSTDASDFPTTPRAFDTSYNGERDAFVIKLAMGGELTPLSSPLTVAPVYPPPSQPSTIMRGGQAHRLFEIRDATGRLAPFVTMTFGPTGGGTSDANGLLDVSFAADSLGGPGSYTLTATGASRWDQVFTLASPVSVAVQVQERPFQHHWYGGTVRKAKGGISAGLVAFLEGQVKGGLGWELEETDAARSNDDRLRLTEQFQAEAGGGAGLGAKVGAKAIISSAEAGAEATTELKGLAQGEWQSLFGAPYTEPEQKAQAVFVLSGLLDMVPEVPGAPALAATIRALGPSVDYASYREKMVTGVGAEWTPAHLHAGAEIKFAGIGGTSMAAVNGPETPAQAIAPGRAASALAPDASLGPLMKLDALDAEATLRLFGTYSEDYARNEWSLALEQEVGFDLDLLAVQTAVTQKLGAYVGERSTKLKEELFFSQATGDPVRFELSLTGEGNATTFNDVALREVTTKFIVEGADLDLALARVRNLTALLAAWDAVQSQGLIAGSSAALQEVQSYLTSVPLSRYEVAAATEGTLEIVPEIGWSGILDIELGAGAEFKQGREIVVERGVATATGLLPTEVYPDHLYGSQSGKTIRDLLGNALTGARLIVEGLFRQVVQSVQQGVAWTIDILGRTVEGIVRGGAQLSGGGGTMYRAAALDGALLAPTAAFTVTASAWAPATGGGTSRSRLLSASGEGFAVGGVYQFSPYTMTLTPPATLVITYTVEAAGAADPNLLHLYRWRPEEANWQPLNATHDLPGRAMTTTIGQLGTYAIGYDGAQPSITMLQPTAVVSQTHLPQISAVITDTGSGVAPASVHLLVGGQPVSAIYAALSGQLRYTGTVFLPNGPYTYTVTAADTAGNLATYEGSFTVSVPAPAVLGTDPPAVPHGVAAIVMITGTDFGYPPVVQVDGVAMTNVGYLGLTAISVTLPANLTLGPHSVSVAAPDGQSGSKAAALTVVDPSTLKPLAPTVAIGRSLESLKLTWLHRTQSVSGYPASVTHYEVWRGVTPYFSPGTSGTNLIAQVIPPPWAADGEPLSYNNDPVAPSEASRFYRVRSVSLYGYISDASSPVGVFNFTLTPGSP